MGEIPEIKRGFSREDLMLPDEWFNNNNLEDLDMEVKMRDFDYERIQQAVEKDIPTLQKQVAELTKALKTLLEAKIAAKPAKKK